MSANGPPTPADDPPPDEVVRLLPLLGRVFDLGRGPPALVMWVRGQLVAGSPAERACRKAVLLRLARDLSGQLCANPLNATVVARPPQTVCVRRSPPDDS